MEATPREHCDFSCSEQLCLTLDKAGIPRDNKWRSLVMYMRGLSYHDYLSHQQKSDLQALLIEVFQEQDFSDAKFMAIMDKNDKIFSAPYIEKIQETVKESHKLLHDFQSTLKFRKGDISLIEAKTASALAKGKDPQEIIASLRVAFKDLIHAMNQDLERLDQLCRTDELTKLYNRRAFDEFLAEELESTSRRFHPLSLIMLDIDDFKAFNDDFGHRVGDQALLAVANIIRRCTEDHSAKNSVELKPARFGGEEFTIILPGIIESDAAVIADNIRKNIEEYNFLIRNEKGAVIRKGISITASFGIAEHAPSHPSPEDALTLISKADKALYYSKNNGKNKTTLFGVIN
jgi:diguanylate cyclase (GGDEF)-like protein